MYSGSWGVDSEYYKFRHVGGSEGCAAGYVDTNFRVQARCCMDGNTENGDAGDLKQLVCIMYKYQHTNHSLLTFF